MEGGSDGLDFLLAGFELDHVRMGAASVGPGEGESLFVWGSSLEEELVLGVEEEDAEGAMGHGVGVCEVLVCMSSPLIDRAEEVVAEGDWEEVVEKDSVG